MNQKFVFTGLFFFFIFLFGYWLNRSGKPYNSLIFNFHKLTGLAMGIYLIVTVYRVYQTGSFNPVQILALGVTITIFIVLVAAGGLLSIEAGGDLKNASQAMIKTVSMIHKFFPYLALIATAGSFYLLL